MRNWLYPTTFSQSLMPFTVFFDSFDNLTLVELYCCFGSACRKGRCFAVVQSGDDFIDNMRVDDTFVSPVFEDLWIELSLGLAP